jgi:hypothetical protein
VPCPYCRPAGEALGDDCSQLICLALWYIHTGFQGVIGIFPVSISFVGFDSTCQLLELLSGKKVGA